MDSPTSRLVRIAAWLCVLATIGCGSDRDLNTADGPYQMGPTKQIQPPDSTAMAISANGQVVAIALRLVERPTIEIRELDSMSVIRTIVLQDGEWPLLLSRDGNKLILTWRDETSFEVRVLDFSTGKRTPTWRGDVKRIILPDPDVRNSKHTICAGKNSLLITSTGAVYKPPEQAIVSFDQYGNAWHASSGTWVRINDSGDVVRLPKPSYLTPTPTSERGPWRLIARESSSYHNGSDAHLTTIWLENLNGVLGGGEAESNLNNANYKTAVVWAGLDVMAFGFVPKRDVVYVVTLDGTYLIPFAKSSVHP